MDKYISLGVDNKPQYLFYIPLVKWAWQQLGWDTFIFFVGEDTAQSQLVEQIVNDYDRYIPNTNGFKTETVAQVSRLYAAWFIDDDSSLIMTSDADILPLSNYWQPNEKEITCYGRDLSDEHFPICFVSMSAYKWLHHMEARQKGTIDDMFRDLKVYVPKAKNVWTTDQNILTERLNKCNAKTLIDRGTDPKTGYPIGRVDRSRWTLDHKTLVDAHLPHDILTNEASFKKVLDLLHVNWPLENWNWFIQYFKEFRKLMDGQRH